MKINYCLPIVKKTKKEVLNSVAKYRDEYQYLEIWLDEIKDIDNPFVDRLIYMLQDKLILLFHRGNDTKTQFSTEEKRKIINLLDNSKSLIDLDLSEKEELEYVKKLNIKTIISYHNYDETPVDLAEIIKEMDKIHPTMYKIATMCNTETDALKLMLLQQNLQAQNKQCIILGMGEFGKITRVFGTLWGNKMIYTPLSKEEESAPGQLTKDNLEKIFKQLE
jgi:3-dehydroquinate dehydratase type I